MSGSPAFGPAAPAATPEAAEAVGLLEGMGLASAGAVLTAEPLSGGVSSDIWLIRTSETTMVLKRPLLKLKVAADWTAPLDRGASEAAWLDYVSTAVPGASPRVLGYDPESFAIALEFLDPTRYNNWKSELLAGRIDVDVAQAVARDLGRIHSASAAEADLAARFAHQDLFESLRIEPYLERTAAAVPAVRDALQQIIASLRSTRIALVHGDVSPKNILVGERPVFLDAECATWSDPAFDAAFCLTHLTLKQLHLPSQATQLRAAIRAFTRTYLAQVDWEEQADAAARIDRLVPALLLARVAGASPVEYLDDPTRHRVGTLAVDALLTGRPIDEVIESSKGNTA